MAASAPHFAARSGFAPRMSMARPGSRPVYGPRAGMRLAGSQRGRGFHRRFRGPLIVTRGFRHRGFFFNNGCGWGGAWSPWCNAGYYGGYYDPWWWDSSASSYDSNEDENEAAVAGQVDALNAEVQRLREERDAHEGAAPTQPAPRTQAVSEASPPTVLVFRDQHKEEIQNYAIVGSTLWKFTPPRTQKIPLAALDLPATTKLNDERGVEFRLPGQGQ